MTPLDEAIAAIDRVCRDAASSRERAEALKKIQDHLEKWFDAEAGAGMSEGISGR
jgi:hypothetical protein